MSQHTLQNNREGAHDTALTISWPCRRCLHFSQRRSQHFPRFLGKLKQRGFVRSVRNTSPLQHLQKAGLAGKLEIKQPVSSPIPRTVKAVTCRCIRQDFPELPACLGAAGVAWCNPGLMLPAPPLPCNTGRIVLPCPCLLGKQGGAGSGGGSWEPSALERKSQGMTTAGGSHPPISRPP